MLAEEQLEIMKEIRCQVVQFETKLQEEMGGKNSQTYVICAPEMSDGLENTGCAPIRVHVANG